MVYLGREEEARKGTELHGLLSTVLSDKLKPDEKKSILKTEYNIAISEELEGGLVHMCNLSVAIAEKSLEKGIEQGIEKGIEKGIEQGKLELLFSLIKKGRITKEEAAGEVNMSSEDFEALFRNA